MPHLQVTPARQDGHKDDKEPHPGCDGQGHQQGEPQ